MAFKVWDGVIWRLAIGLKDKNFKGFKKARRSID